MSDRPDTHRGPVSLLGVLLLGSLLLGVLLPLAPASVRAADPADPDWPCIQRKIPEVSAGMVWAGPPLDGAAGRWRQDPEVARLVGELGARSVPLEEARRKVEAFAAGLEENRDARLTQLFAGLLQTVNRERAQIIGGIERYTRKQRALAQRIEESGARLDSLAEDQRAERERLEQQQAWDIRIYQDREQSLTYLCQQPVDLEQRLFQLARAIAAHLE